MRGSWLVKLVRIVRSSSVYSNYFFSSNDHRLALTLATPWFANAVYRGETTTYTALGLRAPKVEILRTKLDRALRLTFSLQTFTMVTRITHL